MAAPRAQSRRGGRKNRLLFFMTLAGHVSSARNSTTMLVCQSLYYRKTPSLVGAVTSNQREVEGAGQTVEGRRLWMVKGLVGVDPWDVLDHMPASHFSHLCIGNTASELRDNPDLRAEYSGDTTWE